MGRTNEDKELLKELKTMYKRACRDDTDDYLDQALVRIVLIWGKDSKRIASRILNALGEEENGRATRKETSGN